MIDAKSGWHLWGGKYKRRISDLVTLPDEIVKQVLPNLQVALTVTAEKQLSSGYPANSKAYEMYLKGRYFLNQRLVWSTGKANRHFKRAIEEDPGYALAYVGLADSYILTAIGETHPSREAIPKAKAALLQALEIDDNLADAHLTQAKILSTYEFDWDGAEREFKLAIQLDPYHGHARQHYANFLVKLGYFDEALNEINKAFSLDPLSIAINLTMGKIYYFTRKPAQAVKKARELLEIEPRYSAANGLIGFVYLDEGRFAEAIEQFQIMLDGLSADPNNAQAIAAEASDKTEETYFDPEALSFIGYAYAVAGKRKKALDVLEKLIELRKRRYVQPIHVAIVYLGLGEDDAAFEWLDKAVVDRCAPLTYIKIWPFFDRVRSDPRYEDLIRRLRLPL
jgi:tetratricopeptide (TPR) repeat protein